MKYEFKTIGIDEYELHYKKNNEEKVIPFKRTIEMAKKIQGIEMKARLELAKVMSENGLTKNDLIVKKQMPDGTIQYDESNYIEFENKAIQNAQLTVINEVYEMCFKMNLVDILNELDLKEEKEVEIFSIKFGMIIKGQEETPSK